MKNLTTKTIRFVNFYWVVFLYFVLQQFAVAQNTIRVENGKIFSSCNEEIVMRGVNEMFIWSQDRTGERILPEIAKTGSNAVRLVWTTEGAETELDQLINNSIKNSMIPVAELHDATGDFSKLQQLLDYWKRPAVLATIQKYKKWLVVNIGNEVGNGSESTAQWVNYYKDAITQLREAGIDTPLMIDCGGYGNRESYFLEGGNELLEFDPLKNIIFAVHTYWTNGDDQAKIDRLNLMIADAKTKKLPYIIGEGPQKVASPIACGQSFPYVEMMSRLQEEKIGWLSWSWGAVDNNDCGSPNSDLDITTDGKYGSWATNFAQEMCLTDINSIKNTSIIPPSMLDPSIAACGVTYAITASANVGGSISPSGNVIVSEGDNQIFDIASTIGFKIGDVLVDGLSVGAVETYTFSNVMVNHTIEVVFEDVPLPPQVPYFNGVPQPVPGKITATSFDLGGEVVAYHDTTPGNDGNGIRPDEDVDTETGGDGGNIGFTAAGEWIEYTVNVTQSGTYTIEMLVASAVSNGAYHIEFEGVDVTGIQDVAATGGWTTYIPQKISNVMLNAGEQVMRVFMDEGSFNFSTMTFTLDGGTGNNLPIASFTATPEFGVAPLEVTFDGSASSDPNGDVLTYAWDLGNGLSATTVNTSATYDVGTYIITLTVTNPAGESDSISKTITVTDGDVSCTFSTPTAAPLPSINTSFEHIFVLGNGGPNLDNVAKFEVNWDLGNNGLYQFSISTNDGTPNWWNDFLPKVTQNFNSVQPEVTIVNSGFTGLDGSYWVNIHNGNFVMVSKTRGFTIYFSKTGTAPNCDGGGTDPDPIVNGGMLAGGPFTFIVGDGIADTVSGITLSDTIGTNSQWVVTDDQNNILGLPDTIEAVDFDSVGVGTCLIWHLSYENGLQGLAVNNNVTSLIGDFDFSNSISVFRNPVDTGGDGDCNFSTPTAGALPSINDTYTNIFVLGNGGPNLDNVADFGINWGLANNGLYQLSMSTSNGTPSWWIDFLPKVTQNFNQARPSITITDSGIQNLDGSYWATVDANNFVLVSVDGGFTIYFSNSSVAPNCQNQIKDPSIANTFAMKIFPNPVEDRVTIQTLEVHRGARIDLVDITGKIIKTISVESKISEIELNTSDLESGMYFIKLYNNKNTRTQQIIKR